MTVIPDKHAFTIWQGSSFTETLVIYSDASGSTVRNLTGYSAEMIIRDKPQGSQLASANIVISGTDGKVTLGLTPSQTSAITWKSAVYDLTISHVIGSYSSGSGGNADGAYTAGTVTLASNGTVSGTNTTFASSMVGQTLIVNNNNYTITGYTGPTSITVDNTNQTIIGTASTYAIGTLITDTILYGTIRVQGV